MVTGDFRRVVNSRNKKPSPPILSHEFVIQNHGDIMSCILMVVAIGFFFQSTTPISTLFVLPQYNATNPDVVDAKTYYLSGILDWPAILFYTIAWITIHCIIQEFFLDKVQRRLHLSKARQSKFNESGHLAIYGVYTVIHAGLLLHELGVHKDITLLWNNYPEAHRYMNVSTKMFYLIQISFWLHQFPELYFQKIRKEDIPQRSFYSAAFLLLILGAYYAAFVRIGILLVFLESLILGFFHATRSFYFSNKIPADSLLFTGWNITFLLVRLASIIISVLTFWYGFRNSEVPFIEPQKPNFNTSVVRINTLIVLFGLQFYALWHFFGFHFARFRERAQAQSDTKRKTTKKPTKPFENSKKNKKE